MAKNFFRRRELRNYKWLPLLSLLFLPLAHGWASQKKAPETKPTETTETFPMSAGTSWTYRGIVRWSPSVDKVSETKVEWKMEIHSIIRHAEYTGAVIRGFPGDLDWSDGRANPTDSLLVRFGQEKFYLIGKERLASSMQLLENPNESLQGLLSEGDLFLQLPIAKGDKYCDAENMARSDGHYCWIVESAESISLDELTGGSVRGRGTSYKIRYITNPDDTAYDFVPGVGLVGYEYHHHGTVADTELRLSEFRPARPANE
jgi:hypothetical protein